MVLYFLRLSFRSAEIPEEKFDNIPGEGRLLAAWANIYNKGLPIVRPAGNFWSVHVRDACLTC